MSSYSKPPIKSQDKPSLKRISIEMTPKLEAALIRLRDADKAFDASIEKEIACGTRTKEGKAEGRAGIALAYARTDAVDDLIVILRDLIDLPTVDKSKPVKTSSNPNKIRKPEWEDNIIGRLEAVERKSWR
jgi:hypothetical protein